MQQLRQATPDYALESEEEKSEDKSEDLDDEDEEEGEEEEDDDEVEDPSANRAQPAPRIVGAAQARTSAASPAVRSRVPVARRSVCAHQPSASLRCWQPPAP